MVHCPAPIPPYSDAVRFHGHTCPGLALGYRAAVIALEKLRSGPAEDEELVAIVENDACGIDALQVVTGCTAGKGNLVFLDYGKHVYTLVNRRNGTGVRVATIPTFSTAALDPEFGRIRAKAMSGSATTSDREQFEKHLNAVCHGILSIPWYDIFDVRRADVQVPVPAKIYPSVPCDCCGEMVSEHRVVPVRGRGLCIPCSGKKDNCP